MSNTNVNKMTTTNTPFEEGLDEILSEAGVWYNTNMYERKTMLGVHVMTPDEAKTALTQLHKAAIIAELEAIRNVKGETVDAWASPAYQMLLDRIEQYKKEGK